MNLGINEIKRYQSKKAPNGEFTGIYEHVNGDVCLYKDVAARLAEKDTQIAQANKWGGELQRKIAEKDEKIVRLEEELAEHAFKIVNITAERNKANNWGRGLQSMVSYLEKELEQHRKRTILCCHCGMSFGQEVGEQAEDTIRRSLAHERQCERNPMVNELAEKDAEIERLRDAITEHIKEAHCHIDLVYGGPGEYEFIDDCDSVCADCHNRELCMVLAQ